MLFLGDAHNKTIVEHLVDLGYSSEFKLNVDIMKVSHHGSKHNTSSQLLSMINAKKYIISTNGSRHSLPDKETIARILASTETGVISFNYPQIINNLLLPEEKELQDIRLKACNDIRL